MDSSADLPPDLAAAHAMILAERTARLAAEARLAEAANAQAKQSSTEALIAHLKLEIEKLRRTLYGTRSERSARLLDQLELELEELETAATEDELAAETAAGTTPTVRSPPAARSMRSCWRGRWTIRGSRCRHPRAPGANNSTCTGWSRDWTAGLYRPPMYRRPCWN